MRIQLAIGAALVPALASAADLRVPGDFVTVQAAIAASIAGDRVLVSPGTYHERLDFQGKTVALVSTRGPKVTTLDGDLQGPVVKLGPGATLDGFTIRNGQALVGTAYRGGGILVIGWSTGSPAVIQNNVVTGNHAGVQGAGIALLVTRADVLNNTIDGNSQDSGWYGGGGGGIAIIGSSARIVGNDIRNNRWNDGGAGAGIFSYGTGDSLIMNNVVRDNHCDCQGGGIGLFGFDEGTVIIQNLIFGNSAREGGGLYWPAGFGKVLQNTVAQNVARLNGSAFYFDARADWTTFENNLLIGAGNQPAVGCGYDRILMPPMRYNDIYSASSSSFSSTCLNLVGTAGNTSIDPMFKAGGRPFRLSTSSPAIDAGGPTSAALPILDMGGGARIVDGNHDGLAIVDLGAIEYPNNGILVGPIDRP
jgi:serine protease